jgi:hypothetical protein
MHNCNLKLLISLILCIANDFPSTDNILWAKDNNAEMETTIQLQENHHRICLYATYFYPFNNQFSSAQLPIKVQIFKMDQNELVSERKLEVHQDYSWQIEEVVFPELTETEYKILIKVPQNANIGGMIFCNGNGKKLNQINYQQLQQNIPLLGADLITSPDEDVVDCQIIDYKSGSEGNLPIDSNKLTRKNFLFKLTTFL